MRDDQTPELALASRLISEDGRQGGRIGDADQQLPGIYWKGLWVVDQCPVPVIAEVQGDCYGGGVGLVAAQGVSSLLGLRHAELLPLALRLVDAAGVELLADGRWP